MQYDLVAKQLSQPSPESTAIIAGNASSENNKLSSYVSRPWTLPNLLGAVYYERRRYPAKKTSGSDNSGELDEREDIIARYRGPAWLINRAWQIQASKAMCGWNFSLRTSNVIRRDSPVFDIARNGDIEDLKTLFSNGKASPFDCDENGWTILHVRIIILTIGLVRS